MRVLLTSQNSVLRHSMSAALARSGHDVLVEDPAQAGPWDASIEVDHLGARIVVTSRAGEPRLVRAAPAYGVGDDPITLFLVMMRSLPAIPLLPDTHAVRPVWHEDLAHVVAACVAHVEACDDDVTLVGPESISQGDLYERIAALIDRRPIRVPVSEFLATHGARLADALGFRKPFEASHLVFAHAAHAATTNLSEPEDFGVRATGLNDGLRRLVKELSDLTPAHGVGRLEVKRFSTVIHGTRFGPAELLRHFRHRFKDMMPVEVGVEPAAPDVDLVEGHVITMALPGRGHVQVRVECVSDDHVILSTLRGHVLAGIVRFSTAAVDGGVRFEVMTCDTAANALDWLTLSLGGARIQDANWAKVVNNVINLSGGEGSSVDVNMRKLNDDEAGRVEDWIRSVIQRHWSAPRSA